MSIEHAGMKHRNRSKATTGAFMRLVVVMIVLTMTVIGVHTSPNSVALAAGSCTTAVDNPHVSSGAGGIIAKSRFTCTSGVTSYGYSLALYLCTTNPTGTDPATNSSCTIKATNTNSQSNPVANQQYTVYVPPTGQSGLHGTGYWIATNRWTVNSGPYQKTIGNAVYLSA